MFSVIRNPEVLRLSPVLLGAIADPANKTKEALEALLECEFMHSIDAPSLALLVPIMARALRDRGADLKRKSAAITGNMVRIVLLNRYFFLVSVFFSLNYYCFYNSFFKR